MCSGYNSWLLCIHFHRIGFKHLIFHPSSGLCMKNSHCIRAIMFWELVDVFGIVYKIFAFGIECRSCCRAPHTQFYPFVQFSTATYTFSSASHIQLTHTRQAVLVVIAAAAAAAAVVAGSFFLLCVLAAVLVLVAAALVFVCRRFGFYGTQKRRMSQTNTSFVHQLVMCAASVVVSVIQQQQQQRQQHIYSVNRIWDEYQATRHTRFISLWDSCAQ